MRIDHDQGQRRRQIGGGFCDGVDEWLRIAGCVPKIHLFRQIAERQIAGRLERFPRGGVPRMRGDEPPALR